MLLRLIFKLPCLLFLIYAGGAHTLYAGSLSALAYQITDLGALTNSTAMQAYSINNQGQIAGVSTNTSGATTAFLYNATTKTIQVVNNAAVSSTANSINDAGQIAGEQTLVINPKKNTTRDYRYIYSQESTTNIGIAGNAYAINNQGQVVGTVSNQAYLWSASAGQVLLGNSYKTAVAINDSGIMVGQTNSGAGYILNTTTNQTSTITGATMTGINNEGTAIGTITAKKITSSYVWQNGTQTLISPLTDSTSTTAYAINDQGVVVGTSGNKAFVWDSVNGATDLNSLIGTDSGWGYLAVAKDINNLGQIVGWGIKDGQVRAFLLTRVAAPEASVILLILASAVFVFLRYRNSLPA